MEDAIPKIISGGQTGDRSRRSGLGVVIANYPVAAGAPRDAKPKMELSLKTIPCGNRLRRPISRDRMERALIATVPFSFQCRPL